MKLTEVKSSGFRKVTAEEKYLKQPHDLGSHYKLAIHDHPIFKIGELK